jgi:hypothetical protein
VLLERIDAQVLAVQGQLDELVAQRDDVLAGQRLVEDPLVDEAPRLRVLEREVLHAEERVLAAQLDAEGPLQSAQLVDPVALEPTLAPLRGLAWRRMRARTKSPSPPSAPRERELALIRELLEVLVLDVEDDALRVGAPPAADPVRDDREAGRDDVVEQIGSGGDAVPV